MSMSNYDDDKTLRLPRKASRSKHYNERVPIENKLRDELFFGNHASSRSPATRRVYTSMFRAPKWHGATQTHFPPRPHYSAWQRDITIVIRHTVCPHTIEAIIPHDTANHPAHQRHAAFTPASFAPLPSGTAPRKRTFHQGRANPRGTATSRT